MKRHYIGEYLPPSESTRQEGQQHRARRKLTIGAAELAQMGVCERLVVFEHRYGKRRTTRQSAALKRGQVAHDQFYRERERDPAWAEKGRCYIATLAFGPGQETTTLRMFRDQILRPTSMGRWLIITYYRSAPSVCTVLKRHQWLQPVMRAALWPIVWAANRLLNDNGGDHGA